jgi:hypothetical protein
MPAFSRPSLDNAAQLAAGVHCQPMIAIVFGGIKIGGASQQVMNEARKAFLSAIAFVDAVVFRP